MLYLIEIGLENHFVETRVIRLELKERYLQVNKVKYAGYFQTVGRMQRPDDARFLTHSKIAGAAGSTYATPKFSYIKF